MLSEDNNKKMDYQDKVGEMVGRYHQSRGGKSCLSVFKRMQRYNGGIKKTKVRSPIAMPSKEIP